MSKMPTLDFLTNINSQSTSLIVHNNPYSSLSLLGLHMATPLTNFYRSETYFDHSSNHKGHVLSRQSPRFQLLDSPSHLFSNFLFRLVIDSDKWLGGKGYKDVFLIWNELSESATYKYLRAVWGTMVPNLIVDSSRRFFMSSYLNFIK